MYVILRESIILRRLISALLLAITFTSTLAYPMIVQDVEQTPIAAYLEALQTANAFLWAWVTRDAEAGFGLISDRLRAQIKDESWLRQFLVGLSNPHHQAFEIGRGRKQTASRYAFPVTLYEFYTGERAGFRYPGTLELVKQGGRWRVDRLPCSSDNP